jgi:hypothetical protein
MNQRILQLAKESGISLRGYPMNPLMVYPSELQKFSESIVQECADLFEIEWGDEKLTGNDVGSVLKKHFGAE